MVAKMLCEITMKEGVSLMQNIKLNGKPMEKMTREFARKPADSGQIELTYACPPEKEDQAFRITMGIKYLDWPEDFQVHE